MKKKQEEKKPDNVFYANFASHTKITIVKENTQNSQIVAIKNFISKNEMQSVISGKKKCNISLISNATNKTIHKKALLLIIKANKSDKKIKLEAI